MVFTTDRKLIFVDVDDDGGVADDTTFPLKIAAFSRFFFRRPTFFAIVKITFLRIVYASVDNSPIRRRHDASHNDVQHNNDLLVIYCHKEHLSCN